MLYNIYHMDFDEKKRRQLIRVIIAEIGMVLSVTAIVVVATLAAMGFMISDNGSIEQSGLMQLHSLPTGANVKIDGTTLFPRTNLSRTLSSGEHEIELYRDGYDTWSKTVTIRPGVLIRIYYPRLFLQNRVAENVRELADESELEFYSPSTNRSYILYAKKGESEWQLLDIRSDEIKSTMLDLSGVLPGMIEEKKSKTARKTDNIETHNYTFQGQIEEIKWSGNEENVLVKVKYEGKSSWVLVRLRDMARSVNITETFGLDEAKIEFIDDAASQLYVLEKRQLRRISTSDAVISRVLVNNVVDFSNKSTAVIYVAENPTTKLREIGMFRDDDKSGTKIAEVPEDKKVKVAISYYYSEDYLIYVIDNEMTILYGKLPNYNENSDTLDGLKELTAKITLSADPTTLEVSPDGEYIVGRKDTQFMVVDLDVGDLYEYQAPSANLRWLDASMMYDIHDGEILVWDYDGTNQRNLAESAKTSANKEVAANNSPVVITANNRWLYYLTTGKDKETILTREKIRD